MFLVVVLVNYTKPASNYKKKMYIYQNDILGMCEGDKICT